MTLYCPGCGAQLDPADPEVRTSFVPVSGTLQLDGSLDPGVDFFGDYAHVSLECGGKARLQLLNGWSEELGEYVPSVNTFIEAYDREGEYISPTGDSIVFSAESDDDPEMWGPTVALMWELLESSLRKYRERQGD